MGLSGQLEDLPILDIIQLVAFSQKSGYLTVDGSLVKGGVLFANGLVRCCVSSSTLENLRAIGARGEADPQELSRHNEISLRELARLREGRFEFDVTTDASSTFEGIDIAPFLNHPGLNAQRLLLELATGMDEDRRDAAAFIERGAAAPPPETKGETDPDSFVIQREVSTEQTVRLTAEERRAVLPEEELNKAPEAPTRSRDVEVILVDDEPFILEVLSKILESKGYCVRSADGPAVGLAIAKERVPAVEHLVVVMDLKMPTSAGDSFFGGFELAESLGEMGVRLPMLLMTEQLSKEERSRAVALGINKVAFKPTLTKPNPEEYRVDLEAYAGEIARQIETLARGRQDVAASARPEIASPRRAADKSALLLDFVTSMSAQILDPSNRADVTAIVLEVARKYVERCLLFLVRKNLAVGLAGFGELEDRQLTRELAKSMTFGVADIAPLAWVVRNRKPLGPSSELGALDASVYTVIGRGRAREFVLIPMTNNGEVITVLYGDNGRTGRRLERPQGLELVIAQAGMALENAFLHRKLRSREASNVPDHIER